MNSLIYSKNKEALIYNTAVLDSLKAICYPIFNILGFSHFGYIKNFKDGSYLYLCSNPSWLEHHYNKGNTECVDFAKMKRSMITEDIFQSCKWPKEKGNDSIGKLYDFDMWHGLELYYKSEQCIENFYFSSTCNKEISEDFYKKYLSVLKHFVFYFKDRGADLIDCSDKSKLAFQESSKPFYELYQENIILEEDIIAQNSINHIPIRKYYLSDNLSGVYLTNREFECLSLLAKGFAVKEIANLLNVALRTAETHIENMKIKTGINTNTKLASYYHNSILKNSTNLIDCSDKTKLAFQENSKPFYELYQENIITKEDIVAQSFINHTPIKKYYLSGNLSEVYLTNREFECLSLLAKGFAVKEIANLLRVALRTAETHIENMKIKTGININTKLASYYHNSILKHVKK